MSFHYKTFAACILIFSMLFTACTQGSNFNVTPQPTETPAVTEGRIMEETTETGDGDQITTLPEAQTSISLSDVPVYAGQPFVEINNNIPFFTTEELTTTAFERYSPLDSKGRCGVAFANVCQELMPTEERGSIGMVKPSGWHTVKYDFVDGKYLYNRCHLIAYQLAGENANIQNLITGTRFLNIVTMLQFEDRVADYVSATNNHVLYRVTPLFDGDNLLATGVLMEGYSVEDNGKGICYNVFCYNVQPGVVIDYEAISTLTTEQKDLVQKIYFEDWSVNKYAEMLGVDASAVSHRIQRIKNKIKKFYADRQI